MKILPIALGLASAGVLATAAYFVWSKRNAINLDVPVHYAGVRGGPTTGVREANGESETQTLDLETLLGGLLPGVATKLAGDPKDPSSLVAHARRIQDARRTGEMQPLTDCIDEMRAFNKQLNLDQATSTLRGHAQYLLAQSLLERVLQHQAKKGMSVAKALYDEVPPAIDADVTEGLKALDEAETLGTDIGDAWRVRAGLVTAKITGMWSAAGLSGQIDAALKKAAEADPENPRLHVAVGCKKLFAPKLFGGDPAAALGHFRLAADRLPWDERPHLFASLAAWLLHRKQSALEWAHSAVAINPDNTYALAVVKRLEGGEEEPFSRDVDQ